MRGWESVTRADLAKLGKKLPIQPNAKKSKMGNRIAWHDGKKFHSEKERDFYLVLKNQEAHGDITELELQREYAFVVNGILVCRYYLDFQYRENGKQRFIDTKGFRTQEFEIKRKLMKACYGITVECV